MTTTIPVLTENQKILINVKGEWTALDPVKYGEILIKVHNGEVKQIETTTKENY
ncbi:DUF2292 domain-containing protein [Solibacillus sp. FSL W8-0474]|uniref:DUF2292 domain-containing protein n=1 Tax=Solibacillus sp. FSL W8-0474 TaxID=2975336 RepID=UPI0030FB288B